MMDHPSTELMRHCVPSLHCCHHHRKLLKRGKTLAWCSLKLKCQSWSLTGAQKDMQSTALGHIITRHYFFKDILRFNLSLGTVSYIALASLEIAMY